MDPLVDGDVEVSEMERLAHLRAKKEVKSWSVQAKSPWTWLTFLLGFAGAPILLGIWIASFDAQSQLGLREAITVTLGAVVACCLLWLAHKGWEDRQLHKSYDIEILELKAAKPAHYRTRARRQYDNQRSKRNPRRCPRPVRPH